MVEPSPNNSDDELTEQPSVQQNISDGSSNSGTVQSGVAGNDTNIIDGDGNHISYIYNYSQPSTPSKVDEPTVPREPEIKRNWRDRPLFWASLALIFLSLGTFLALPKTNTIMTVNQCKPMSQKQEIPKRIIVANIYNANSNQETVLLTETRLQERLEADLELNNFEICLANEVVSTSKEAQRLGEKLNAEIVIWGRRDTSSFELYLEGIKQELRYLSSVRTSSTEALEYELQSQDLPGLVTVMVAVGISNIYYSNNQTSEAREVLANALDTAELRELPKKNQRNAEYIAQAYFLLGTMFSAKITNCQEQRVDCRKAIQYYRRASELDETLEWAFINQGVLYQELEELDAAKSAYSKLIDSPSKSELVAMARSYRARILLSEGRNEAALNDLKLACEQEPENLEYYHFLGLAQLHSAKISEAKQTYQYIKRNLDDKQLKAEIIEELNSFDKKVERKDIDRAIHDIVSTL